MTGRVVAVLWAGVVTPIGRDLRHSHGIIVESYCGLVPAVGRDIYHANRLCTTLLEYCQS